MTTKRQLLNALAGHHIANDQELQMVSALLLYANLQLTIYSGPD